ncbi:BTB/POZ domain-containing protein 7 isoform X3 [Cherax quadricarinatus]|uniref:BTB/POZ domain-containing protein 7 isoform X3 n=1 Tax=Cherax quadricarinatus TaxID=27406 RepID=UPI0023791331|nr:BTB/POZ domain-containing protein 7-like isoform X3 [Cherax quadricarinatus]XP_053638043.1 BTB/POZ domain-containing protein 7-like isoform X3 [Cherax quadricarinatus]
MKRMGVNASCQADAGVGPQAIFSAEKKKKLTSLATLRKKLIRRRRSSKSCDHARVIRELVSDWMVREVTALYEEYEASAALKDLTVQADLARPPAPTYKQDLSDLFDYKYCTDVDLVFQGAIFPVHRAILSVRCPYFQEVLKKIPGYGAQIGVDIRTPGIDIPMFSALLRYLYTGEFNAYDGTSKAQMGLSNLDMLMQLCEEFGTPNPLECDLKYLLESGDYADCVLVFSASGDVNQSDQSGEAGPSDYGFHNRLELYCHKAILSARSPFFRSLIQRRQRYSEDMYERGIPQPTRIVLDEGVIPKRYARVLLHAVYLDTLDLSCIIRDSTSTNSLSEAQSIVQTGRTHMTVVEEAMEIYQIGRFLELDILTQGCEDMIVESLSLDNLVSILRWSGEAHGSAWVHRQALHFLREEFSQVAQSGVLLELEKSTLLEALTSDFLQAAELDVLQATLRWGEHQLLRRMEDREPNLVSQTAHSVTRKGLRKRDMNDVELREILSELLPHVRMDHVLPPNHDILTQAIKRGLVSTPPSHMIGDDTTNYRVNAWIRSKNNGLFVKPRLFTPYAEEIKSVVDEQTAGGVDVVRLQCYVSHIPDALYMVEDNAPHQPSFAPSTTVDVVAAAIPVPDSETVLAMVRRERELVSSPGYQRAASLLFGDRRMLRRQVRLRVVREFNLPDSVADVLEGASYTEEEEEEVEQRCSVRDEGRSKLHPPEFLLDPLLDPPPHHFRLLQGDEGHLSDVMPDVALASSSLSALHLGSSNLDDRAMGSLEGLEDLEGTQMSLDLGDGSHHQVGSHLTLGGSHRRRSSRRYRLPPHLTPPPSMSGHHTYGGPSPRSPHTPPLRPHTTTATATTTRHHATTTPPLFL